MTDDEAAAVAGHEYYFEQPTRADARLLITGDTTLTNVESGKKVVSNHLAPCTVTLPASPTAGARFEIFFGDTASADNITVARNGHTIDGAAANYTLTPALDSVGLYYNGAGWITF
jgi:hypothetical protein